MRCAGGRSWRFSHGVEQWPHAVLYVRGALDLGVKPAPGVPPGLIEKVPDHCELLEPSARAVAARDWLTWWDTIIRYESRAHVDCGAQDLSAIRERAVEYGEAIDPARPKALSGTALQPAAKAVFAEAQSWGGRVDMPDPGGNREGENAFQWEVIRDTAEAVAAAHRVDVGEIDGAASILFVKGVWWELVAPGHVFCSLAAAQDQNVAAAMLRSAFESRLAAT